jgi:hypothetical protein
VVGCGLLLNAKNKVEIFFTTNGILMGKLIMEIGIQMSLK